MSFVNSFRNEPWMVVGDQTAWPTGPLPVKLPSSEEKLVVRKLDQLSILSPSAEPFEPRQTTSSKKQSKKKAPSVITLQIPPIPIVKASDPPTQTPTPPPIQTTPTPIPTTPNQTITTPTEPENGAGTIEDELAKQSLYKTELCRSFCDTGICRYGHKCQFAHGLQELRVVARHPKYKTENCKTFVTSGTCPYGPRCRFIHPPPSGAGGSPAVVPPNTVDVAPEPSEIISVETPSPVEWSTSWNVSTATFGESWNTPSSSGKKNSKKTTSIPTIEPTLALTESEMDEQTNRLSVFKTLAS